MRPMSRVSRAPWARAPTASICCRCSSTRRSVRVEPSALPDVLIIDPDVHVDGRGFFVETYHADRYRKHGVGGPFVQDNHSRSVARTLRGMHLQLQHPQGKLIRAIEG